MQSLEVLRRSPTADYVATVLESTLLTPTIKSIRLRLDPEGFHFLPGQSVWPRFEREGRRFSKIYSIASSPSLAPEIELCVSRVGWSSAYLHDLPIGQSISLRGPYGLMTLDRLPPRPRLYLAEGSGIAPLKSQIDWLYESGFAQPVWLLLANPETPDCLPYDTYWRSLAQRWNHFHYQGTVAGRLEPLLLADALSLNEFDVEVCAVGDRMEQLVSVALAMGASAERLRSEKFVAF